ncbi:hypothetical protein D4R89_11775 [bacterium]|nr:MAG: hypothetical protein D4R89_11775 [bacterium]
MLSSIEPCCCNRRKRRGSPRPKGEARRRRPREKTRRPQRSWPISTRKWRTCRQLRPVLQKIRKDYTGKLEVLIIDVRNNQKLASDYQIQVIPTVVFFDPAGKEIFRHQGFMSEEKVKEQLAKMGVV